MNNKNQTLCELLLSDGRISIDVENGNRFLIDDEPLQETPSVVYHSICSRLPIIVDFPAVRHIYRLYITNEEVLTQIDQLFEESGLPTVGDAYPLRKYASEAEQLIDQIRENMILLQNLGEHDFLPSVFAVENSELDLIEDAENEFFQHIVSETLSKSSTLWHLMSDKDAGGIEFIAHPEKLSVMVFDGRFASPMEEKPGIFSFMDRPPFRPEMLLTSPFNTNLGMSYAPALFASIYEDDSRGIVVTVDPETRNRLGGFSLSHLSFGSVAGLFAPNLLHSIQFISNSITTHGVQPLDMPTSPAQLLADFMRETIRDFASYVTFAVLRNHKEENDQLQQE